MAVIERPTQKRMNFLLANGATKKTASQCQGLLYNSFKNLINTMQIEYDTMINTSIYVSYCICDLALTNHKRCCQSLS